MLAAIAVAGAGAVVWLVGWSDVTALQDVHVKGVDGTLRTSVTSAAQPPLGTPLIRVDTAAMSAKVEKLPEIAQATASRSWPNSVEIEVTPRSPKAIVSDGSSWWRVDETGVLFGRTDRRPDGLPVLDAPTGPDASQARSAGVAVITGLPPKLREIVTAVAAPTAASVELTLDSGATVVWGTADQPSRKAQVLGALLDVEQDASVYDVAAPSKPAVRR